ncbi:hypothetical protein THRCLA_21058 [Thraustotheca clavata]|uniref:Tim44-like domain-containing protein n=1 Tax=Thraustotheca clavata TaxID=74557 RepID=A0A1W0A0V4_9STRA|nr:hypothetical protein THRCLA_21058 [Thraustotheca clavata]
MQSIRSSARQCMNACRKQPWIRVDSRSVGLTRAFSTSPPSFELRALADSVERAYDDRERLYNWNDKELFKAETSFVKKALSFALLHHVFPSSSFDLVDFLDGAQVALDLVLNTIYTQDFQDYLQDSSKTSPPVELLQNVMSPECFNALVKDFTRSRNDDIKIELVQLDIHSAQFSGLLVDGQQMKLILSVLYHTTEHLTKTNTISSPLTSIPGKEVRDSFCQWTFETSIADPRNPDWVLVDMYNTEE